MLSCGPSTFWVLRLYYWALYSIPLKKSPQTPAFLRNPLDINVIELHKKFQVFFVMIKELNDGITEDNLKKMSHNLMAH